MIWTWKRWTRTLSPTATYSRTPRASGRRARRPARRATTSPRPTGERPSPTSTNSLQPTYKSRVLNSRVHISKDSQRGSSNSVTHWVYHCDCLIWLVGNPPSYGLSTLPFRKSTPTSGSHWGTFERGQFTDNAWLGSETCPYRPSILLAMLKRVPVRPVWTRLLTEHASRSTLLSRSGCEPYHSPDWDRRVTRNAYSVSHDPTYLPTRMNVLYLFHSS